MHRLFCDVTSETKDSAYAAIQFLGLIFDLPKVRDVVMEKENIRFYFDCCNDVSSSTRMSKYFVRTSVGRYIMIC